MQSTVTCRSCGTVLGIPKSGMPDAGLECNWCGSLNRLEAPPVPAPRPAPVDPPIIADSSAADTLKPPEAKPVAPKPARHRWADDEDDDGQPYEIPDSQITHKPCGSCGKEIARDAVVCVHCGHDHQTKKKGERVFSAIDREWEEGWPFQRRLAVFAGCQFFNLLSLIVGLSSGVSAGPSIFGLFTFVALQAFILGTYPRVRVRRNKKGQAEITTTWRAFFYPLETKKVDWRSHEGVSVGLYDGSGILGWIMFFNLLPLCIPALLWWWFVIRSDHYFTALTVQNASPETYLYRGLSQAQSKEIAQAITDATGLTLNTPL